MEYDSIPVLSQAKETFQSMMDFKDSRKRFEECEKRITALKKQEERKNRGGLKGFFGR